MTQTGAWGTGKRTPAEEDPHVLDTVDRLKAMADPLRIQIVLELLNGPRTVKEVADSLGVPPTRLYYHVKILERHGLIEVANRRMVSGIEERTYRTTSDNWTVSPTLAASAIYESGALRALFDVARAEVEAALQGGPDVAIQAPASPLQGIGITELALSSEDLPELISMFEKVLRKFAVDGNRRQPGKELFHFFYALYSVPTTSSADGE